MKLRSKRGHWLWSWLSPDTYTTIWETVYCPVDLESPADADLEVLQHEQVHIDRYKKISRFKWIAVPVFLFLYIFCPVPVLFAYFRWWFEREAYLVEIRHGTLTPELAADILWRSYVAPWPKSWMQSWFEKQIPWI